MPPRAEGTTGGDDASRVARIWELVSAQAASRDHAGITDVCTAAATSLSVSGAWVIAGDGTKPRQAMCATDVVSESLAEVQITLGEGPCHDALVYGVPALAASLSAESTGSRWAAFTDAALRAGAAAVFGFPLRIGAIRVGVLGLYRDMEGPLNMFHLGDALILADAATVLLLDAQARQPQDPLSGAAPAAQSPRLAAHHAEIAQATGMLTEQLGVSISVAFARLRAYSYAQERRLSEVAHDIVTRRLRLDPDPPV